MNELMRNTLFALKKHWYIPLAVLIGIAIMLYQEKQDVSSVAVIENSEDEYVEKTERKVNEILSSIPGTGECFSKITLSSGSGKEYVREDGKVLIITDKDGNQTPVLARENSPKIAGVTVFSEGAQNITVRNNIIRAVSSVLGIGTNKIYVLSLDKE